MKFDITSWLGYPAMLRLVALILAVAWPLCQVAALQAPPASTMDVGPALDLYWRLPLCAPENAQLRAQVERDPTRQALVLPFTH